MADLLLGRVLQGRYELLALVGQGSMGRVYRARAVRLGFDVAVKLIQLPHADDDKAIRRFRREAEAAIRLEHEGITRLFDLGEDGDDGTLFIVMELLAGETLARKLARDGPFSDEQVIELLLALLAALEHAHDKKVVHRDLKPANIQCLPDGRYKLCDLGVAALKDPEVTRLTRAGALLGTPGWMAPEQVRGEEVDGRADLYALGVLAFQLLTGAPPFRAERPEELLRKHLNEPAPELSALRPGTDPALAAVVARALAKQPEQRFANARAMAEAIRPGAPQTWARPQRLWPTARLAALAIGLIALGVGLAAALLQAPPPRPGQAREVDERPPTAAPVTAEPALSAALPDAIAAARCRIESRREWLRPDPTSVPPQVYQHYLDLRTRLLGSGRPSDQEYTASDELADLDRRAQLIDRYLLERCAELDARQSALPGFLTLRSDRPMRVSAAGCWLGPLPVRALLPAGKNSGLSCYDEQSGRTVPCGEVVVEPCKTRGLLLGVGPVAPEPELVLEPAPRRAAVLPAEDAGAGPAAAAVAPPPVPLSEEDKITGRQVMSAIKKAMEVDPDRAKRLRLELAELGLEDPPDLNHTRQDKLARLLKQAQAILAQAEP